MDLIEETLQDIIPPREIPRRKLIHSGIAQQKFRRAVLEAGAEIASEFTEHYWKEVVNGGKSGHVSSGTEPTPPPPLPPPTSNQSLKQRFVYYLNASGRYLVLREHLRQAVSTIVQQRCLNLRPSGFQSHRDFQTLLHDMYNYLVDEMHESLNRTKLTESDPLDPPPPKIICDPDAEPPSSMKELGSRTLLRELLFYSEESFVQGDFDNCHRIHLQRICRSREDAGCWLDFALMWLSRGDDRMAEIAVREALRRDSNSIYALVIGGIIAIRHNDARGVSVLGAALDMKPLSPELCVILALAHLAIGAEEEGDYFFRKAAYLHRTLTGQSTEDLDEMLTKLKKSVGLSKSISNLSKIEADRAATEASELAEAELALQEPPPEESPTKEGTDQGSSTRKGKKTKSKKGARKSKKTGSNDSINTEDVSADKKSSKDIEGQKRNSINETGDAKGPTRRTKTSSDKGQLVLDTEEEEEGEEMFMEEFYTRKMSLTREAEEKHVPEHVPLPKVDFVPALSDLIVEDSILPPLRPSLLIPWNVTDASKAVVVANPSEPPNTPAVSQVEDGDLANRTEYEEMLEEEEAEEEETPTPRRASKDAGTETTSKKGRKSKRKSIVKETPSENVEEQASARTSLTNNNAPEMEVEELFLSPEAMPDVEVIDSGNGDGGSLPVFVNRVGSELIWTGQLLLKLRMFDMLDGVLTRELYSSGQRSMQFLYLRAMSLYIRRCQREALPIIDEALRLDADNPVLWILRGHCFYEIGEPDEAAKNYETALRIPVGKENRHLLYLRFGSLALDAGNYDTAKRVFLYGIQKYPTPYLWLAIGNTCYTMGNLEEAEAAFAEANRLDNTNPITWAHLALINLACDRQALAEQAYKWAMRFGLKKGKIMDEIKKLQVEKGFGDPSFPRIPHCIPHDYYVRRLGRQNPFDIYKDALLHETPNMGKKRFENTERENMLIDKLQGKTPSQEMLNLKDEQTQLSDAVETTDEATEPANIEPEPEPEAIPESAELPGEVTSSSNVKRKKSRKNKSKPKRGGAARESNFGRPSNPGEGARRRSPGSQERSRDSSKKMSFRRS